MIHNTVSLLLAISASHVAAQAHPSSRCAEHARRLYWKHFAKQKKEAPGRTPYAPLLTTPKQLPCLQFLRGHALTLKCRCTADEVYLQPLADKFARLVLQLLARYAVWLAEGLSARRASGSTGPPQDPPSAVSQVKSSLLLLPCLPSMQAAVV